MKAGAGPSRHESHAGKAIVVTRHNIRAMGMGRTAMNSELQNKIAVVTGASRGLGRCVAVKLAQRGAKVALVARNSARLDELRATIERDGGTALPVVADAKDPEAVARLKTTVEGQLGKPSILVNAAGIFGPIQRIADSSPERWIETVLINMVGPYLICRAFLTGMLEMRWGRIVNFSSAAAFHQPGPLNSAYATSKVGLNQFTRHLAAEIAGTGVTANVIHPGDVKTEMWAAIRDEVNRAGPEAMAFRDWVEWVDQTGGDDPDKAADLVLKLVGDESASVNGQFLWIENGLQAPISGWAEPAGSQPWAKG